MIKFKCTQCGEGMEAPECLIGQKLACPACEYLRKVPKTSPKPRPATDGQRSFASQLGIDFSEDISFDEIHDKIDSFQTIRYFVMAVWLELTKKKLFESGIQEDELLPIIHRILADEDLAAQILKFEEWRYDKACEERNRLTELRYEQIEDEDEEIDEADPVLSIQQLKVSVKEFPDYTLICGVLLKEWYSHLPESLLSVVKEFFE